MLNLTMRHIIITRFNCRFGNLPKHLTIDTPSSPRWLDDRFDLFERYCAPTLLAQTSQDFVWFVYFDRNTPKAYIERAKAAMQHRPNMKVMLCDAFTIETLKDDIRREIADGCAHLLTTRLDNDDGLHSGFVARLQSEVRAGTREALNFPVGLVLGSGRLYRSIQPSNAFISVSEPYDDGFMTVHCGSHNAMASQMPIREIGKGEPAWLQVVHGGNVSNKLRGQRVRFRDNRAGFLPLEHIDASTYEAESGFRIAVENLSVGAIWALRDHAARLLRQIRHRTR